MKCEICGKVTEDLEECEYCPDCGQAFMCDNCFDEQETNENHYHGCFF